MRFPCLNVQAGSTKRSSTFGNGYWYLIALCCLSLGSEARRTKSQPYSRDVINQLSKLFGISKIPVHLKTGTPPQYMTDLYDSITDVGGLVKSRSPYNADTIRSYPDRDGRHQLHFRYRLSRHFDSYESVLAAEFHVFKLKAMSVSSTERKLPHVIQLKLYQVLRLDDMHSLNSLRLLDVKRISAYYRGWIQFKVTAAVNDWLNKTHNNGFLLTVTSVKDSKHINESHIRFAQRHEHHQSKQPVLILFTHNKHASNRRYISPNDENYKEIMWDILKKEIVRLKRIDYHKAVKLLNEEDRKIFIRSKRTRLKSLRMRRRKLKYGKEKRTRNKKKRGRTKREVSKLKTEKSRKSSPYYKRTSRKRTCSRQKMYVDFEEIGWSGWIISPKGYNAYHCTGECPFPLGQNQKPTNHATVQSIVHALRVGKRRVNTPCCVPDKLYSISLLYFDDEENVILKQYDEMVASSCGCH